MLGSLVISYWSSVEYFYEFILQQSTVLSKFGQIQVKHTTHPERMSHMKQHCTFSKSVDGSTPLEENTNPNSVTSPNGHPSWRASHWAMLSRTKIPGHRWPTLLIFCPLLCAQNEWADKRVQKETWVCIKADKEYFEPNLRESWLNTIMVSEKSSLFE